MKYRYHELFVASIILDSLLTTALDEVIHDFAMVKPEVGLPLLLLLLEQALEVPFSSV